MLRVYGCVFCSIPLLFVYLRMRIFSNLRSIAGVPFDSARRFRASLLLHTTRMRSCCSWSASCVAAEQNKTKTKKLSGLGLCRVFVCIRCRILTGHATLTNECRGVLLVRSYVCPLRTEV